MSECVSVSWSMYGGQSTSLGIIDYLSYHVRPRGETQIIRHGSKCLYPQSHLSNPGNISIALYF